MSAKVKNDWGVAVYIYVLQHLHCVELFVEDNVEMQLKSVVQCS